MNVFKFRLWRIPGRLTTGLVFLLWFGALALQAGNRYVVEPGTPVIAPVDPANPYTNWAEAATNIKWAVDAANSNAAGDNVIISNGIYYVTEPIVVSNAMVTNYSGVRTNVTVNGNYPAVTSRCFIMRHPNAVLSGLTITNGYATTNELPELQGSGGGIWATNGIVRNCLITGCRSEMTNYYCGGGGIYAMNATMDFCSVIGNIVQSKSGAPADLANAGGGGGAFFRGGLITNCFVGGNQCLRSAGNGGVSGGGISGYSSIRISNCTIVSNTASGNGGLGGGIFTRDLTSVGVIENSRIAGNQPNGGGISLGWPLGTLRNCLIANNSGYGIYIFGGTAAIKNIDSCTIVSNTSGGIYYSAGTGTKTNVRDCIVYYNGGGTNLYDATGGPLTTSVMYSCVAPGSGFTIDGVVTNEPLFVDMAAGNYHLSNNSPCINSGTNVIWMMNSVDLDGQTRIRYGTVDMGAYERFHEGTIYIAH